MRVAPSAVLKAASLIGYLALWCGPRYANAQCAQDCMALTDFARATLVQQWTVSRGWPVSRASAAPVCEWYGVRCNGGRVTEISLENNNLGGSLPESLGQLRFLTSLRVGGERPPEYGLYGKSCVEQGSSGTNFNSHPLPESIYTLSSLQTISIENACLGGTLSSAIGALTSLQNLEIHGNYISGTLPPAMDYLDSLVEHKLGRNPISGTVPAFTRPKKMLTKYNCNFCALTGTFPDNFSPSLFPSLTQAFWDGNGFTGSLPGSLGSIATLQQMSFNINNFRGDFPVELCDNPPDNCRIGNGHDGNLAAYQARYPWSLALNVSGNRFSCTNGVPCCIQKNGVCNHTSGALPAQESLFHCIAPEGQPDFKPKVAKDCSLPTWAVVLIVISAVVVAGGIAVAVVLRCKKHDEQSSTYVDAESIYRDFASSDK